MKIAIFSDTFLPQANGVATVVSQSAKTLSALGHEVWIFTICQKSKKEPFWAEEKIAITILPSIPVGAAYKGERLNLPVGIAFRRLKEFQPDIIHTHTPFGVGWEAVWAAKKLKIPLVGTHHTFYDHYLKHIKADYEWVKKISWKYTIAYYNFCDLILSPSQSLADALSASGLKKPVETLRNPIETDLFQPCDEKTKACLKTEFGLKGKSIVYAGRVSYEKSIDQAIRAFALAARQNSEIELMIVGDGPEKNNLEKLAGELKIKQKVIFTGNLKREESFLRALQANDAFITASKSENMPMTVLEAMSCGLPVMAVSEKGLNELIRDGVNGFLVKADDNAAMAQKIIELFANQELLIKFGRASRSLSMEYSKENVAALLINVYQRALKLKSLN